MVETEKKTKQRMKIRGKNAYIVMLSIIVIVCCICALHQLTNSVSATVRINSVLSSDGQNPDGSPFSIMELFSDEVMNLAVENLKGRMTARELRNHLSVSDTMTDNSYEKLEQSVFDGENENTYFPTEYLLTYSTISEQIRNDGFFARCNALLRSIFLPSKTKILKTVLGSYEQYYAERYLNYGALFEIDWAAVDAMDYYNRFSFMDDTIQRLMRFLQYKNNRSMAQSGTYTDSCYHDLIIEFSEGPAHGIKDYQAYVTQNGVTNDKEALLRQFAYMQELCEEEHIRKTTEHDVLQEAIEMYDSTTTKVVFIPALDDSKEFYMNRTNIGLDYLSEKADSAKLQADSAKYSAKHYAYLQTCFGAEQTSGESGGETQIKNTPAQRAHADELYENLKQNIQRLTAEAGLLANNGEQAEPEELKTGKPFRDVSFVGVAMSFAKRFVLLAMFAYVLVYTAVAINKKKQKEEEV